MAITDCDHLTTPNGGNTRYGTHGEAAAVLVVYRKHFISFMESVQDGKDKPVFTNIEKNFYLALQDPPTFTKLCVLSMYCVCVSQPFMRYVRTHDNILTFREFFERKTAYLLHVHEDPSIWTSPEHMFETAALDGKEWDPWTLTVVNTIRQNVSDLPCLHGAISAFALGARTTFSERFSDEFAESGDIASLSDAERSQLYFASTNDANEGGLGSYRLSQRARPTETLHKFNASYMGRRNQTEQFVAAKLSTEEDARYLRQKEREKDASGQQRALKVEQMKADEKKVIKNREKEAVREARHENKKAAHKETGQNLVLDNVGIQGLSVKELDRQLDYHREHKKQCYHGHATVPIKKDLGKKAEKIVFLQEAVARYHLWASQAVSDGVSEERRVVVEVMDATENDDEKYYLSDHHDDNI